MRVVLADDSLVVREGIAALLRRAGFDVVAQASTGEELLEFVGEHAPDVAIVDVRMPPTFTEEGIRAAHALRKLQPGIGIVILSQQVEAGIAMRVLAEEPAGLGYLLKDRVTDVEDFAAALRRVAAGGTALDPKVVSGLLASRSDEAPLANLSRREREVLGLVAEGLSNRAIGERLVITERAVQKHVTSIFARLDLPAGADAHRRILAVLAYLFARRREERRVTHSRWLPLALAPVGIAAVAAGFVLLFDGGDDVTRIAVVNRSVGGSFIACGLIAWWRRPDNGTGPLMTITGILYLGVQLLAEADSDLLFTLSELAANWWIVTFAALVLAFPGGKITARLDRALLAALTFGIVVVQVFYLAFLPFEGGPDNLLMISADPGTADAIDTVQRSCNTTIVFAIMLVGAARWLRAAPVLRRLLLPTLAGSVALLILTLQSYYQLFAADFIRPSQDVAVVVLVSVPLAFLLGVLRAQLARARMANLVVELQRTPDIRRLGEMLSRALDDPSLELVYWLRGFDCYVDADGKPVVLPENGNGRAATPIDHDGEHIAALIHDPALTHDPELLEIVSAATYVALERRRLQEELESQVRELAGSRARLVEAGDAARRKLERDLHDGAQQRLVSLAIALRITEDRVRDDPEAAGELAAARRELAESLDELRELARGIHPAVLEHGLDVALQSLAARSPAPVTLELDLSERLPRPVDLAAYFVACEALANVGKYAQASRVAIRASRRDGVAAIEIADDGVGGANANSGSGLRGLADRVEALGGRLRVISRAGEGTVVAAELPCEQPATSA